MGRERMRRLDAFKQQAGSCGTVCEYCGYCWLLHWEYMQALLNLSQSAAALYVETEPRTLTKTRSVIQAQLSGLGIALG